MKSKNLKFDSVAFDVDSTLVTIEGLDYMASLKNKVGEISQITKLAMNGEISMKDAMEKKMAIISPSITDLTAMGNAYIKNIVTGVVDTIKTLNKNNIKVWIVTGNFQPGVGILADHLGIKPEYVITNVIYHDSKDSYLSFDTNNPLSNNGGKKTMIKKMHSQLGRVCFVGDGSTDLDTQEEVELFIGFGGVIKRGNIEKNSHIYISNPDMTSILSHLNLSID